MRSALKTDNARIEMCIERQTLWPDGNVQWAADGTGLKMGMRGQVHSLWPLPISRGGPAV